MQIKDWQKDKIVATMCAFEQSSKFMRYEKIYTLFDGYKGRKQVTVSIGFTEDEGYNKQGGGSLERVVKIYYLLKGVYASQLLPYIEKIGKGVLADSSAFKALLVEMAEKDPLWGICQELAYRELYVKPAFKKCEAYGIETPLGALIIQDSYLQGSLDTVANMFKYPRPSRGGDEKEFLKQYLIARRRFLLGMEKTEKTVYRIDCLEDCIKRDNWDLSKPIYANGTTI